MVVGSWVFFDVFVGIGVGNFVNIGCFEYFCVKIDVKVMVDILK